MTLVYKKEKQGDETTQRNASNLEEIREESLISPNFVSLFLQVTTPRKLSLQYNNRGHRK
jgi:hypothetical protein